MAISSEIDPKETYIGEQVFAYLAKAQCILLAGSPTISSSGEWKEVWSKNSIKKEKAIINGIMRKNHRKLEFSLTSALGETCWTCGKGATSRTSAPLYGAIIAGCLATQFMTAQFHLNYSRLVERLDRRDIIG